MGARRGLVAWVVGAVFVFGAWACGGSGHNAPPDAAPLGTRVDSPIPTDQRAMSDGGQGDAADAGAPTTELPDGQALPTSNVTSPS